MGVNFTTYTDYRAKLELDLDLQQQDFVGFDELVTIFNEAILEAESELLTVYEEYFLASDTITLVSGTGAYSLPSDIFAQKIRAIVYQNGTDIYKIRRIKRLDKFLQIHLDRQFSTGDTLRYFISNESASAGFKLELVPTPTENGTYLTIYYIRNANRVPLAADGSQSASNATTVDLPPECSNFLLGFCRERVIGKEERGSPSHQLAVAELNRLRQHMVDTLTARFVDDDDEVEGDQSMYWEHS